jgi:hypothetical protein
MARQQNRAHLDLGDEKIPEKKVEAIGGLRRGGGYHGGGSISSTFDFL